MGLLEIVKRRVAESRAARARTREQREAYVAALDRLAQTGAQTGAASLPPPAGLSSSHLRRLNDDAFRQLADRYLADDLLTEQEERDLLEVGVKLGVTNDRLAVDFEELRDRLVVARLNDGRLPTIDPGEVILKKGELAHASTRASLLKEVVKREYRGAYGGVSIRVAKGVRVHTGRVRGHSVVVGSEIVTQDSGVLTITSKRVLFAGSKTALEFAYPRLIELHVYSDGVRLAVSNRKTPSVFRTDASGEVVAAMINAALQAGVELER